MAHSGNSQIAIRVLVGISIAQTLAVAGFAAFLVVELFIATPDSWASAVFLALIGLGFAVALGAISRGIWRGTPSARSASLVWQVLQMALGLASDDGVFGRVDIALVLIAPAAVALGLLLFSPGVRKHFENQ